MTWTFSAPKYYVVKTLTWQLKEKIDIIQFFSCILQLLKTSMAKRGRDGSRSDSVDVIRRI